MDWFNELKKKSDKSINQNEDFLTAVFAGLLQANLEYKKFMLKFLFERSINLLENSELKVQDIIENGRADISISDDNFYGIIECKVDATYDKDQIIKYQKCNQDKKFNEVIFIGRMKPKDNICKEFLWFDIFNKTKKYVNELGNQNYTFCYLVDEFEKLLMDLGLIIIPLKIENILETEYFKKYDIPKNRNEIEKSIRNYLETISYMINPKNTNNVFGQEDWFEIVLKEYDNSSINLRIFLGYKDPNYREILNLMIYLTNPSSKAVNDLLEKKELNFEEIKKISNQIGGVDEGICFLYKIDKENKLFWSGDMNDQMNFFYSKVYEIYSILIKYL